MGLTKGAPYKGRGEGAFPPVLTRGESPSPGAQERADLSPQSKSAIADFDMFGAEVG